MDEYDVYDEETDLNAFIETTRWFGIKTRLSWMNILDLAQSRDRTVYVGERELSPVDSSIALTRRRVYGKSSGAGRTASSLLAAKAPWPISLLPGPRMGLISPTRKGGKL